MRSDVRDFYSQIPADYSPMAAMGHVGVRNPLAQNQAIEAMLCDMCGLFTADAKARALAMGDTGATVAADAMSVGGAAITSAMQSAQNGTDTDTALANAAIAAGGALIKSVTSGSGSSSSSGATNTSGGPWQPGQPTKIYDQTWDGTAKGIAALTASADGKKTAAQVQGIARHILAAALAKTNNLTPFQTVETNGTKGRLMVNSTQLALLVQLQSSLSRAPTRAEAAKALSVGYNRALSGTRSGAGGGAGPKTTSGATVSGGASLPLLAALGGAAVLALRAMSGGG